MKEKGSRFLKSGVFCWGTGGTATGIAVVELPKAFWTEMEAIYLLGKFIRLMLFCLFSCRICCFENFHFLNLFWLFIYTNQLIFLLWIFTGRFMVYWLAKQWDAI